MTSKMRKKCNNSTQKCSKTIQGSNKQRCNKNAIKGTQFGCRLKSCKATKYKSVYGMSGGGIIRSNPNLFSA